jgi:hypothetical protein
MHKFGTITPAPGLKTPPSSKLTSINMPTLNIGNAILPPNKIKIPIASLSDIVGGEVKSKYQLSAFRTNTIIPEAPPVTQRNNTPQSSSSNASIKLFQTPTINRSPFANIVTRQVGGIIPKSTPRHTFKSLRSVQDNTSRRVGTPSQASSTLTLKLKDFNLPSIAKDDVIIKELVPEPSVVSHVPINIPMATVISPTVVKPTLQIPTKVSVPTPVIFNTPDVPKINIKVKDVIERTNIHSRKNKLNLSGSTPDWDNLPESEKEYYFNEYDVRFNILVRSNTKFNITKPERGTSLSAYIHSYDENVNVIKTSMMTTNGKILVSLAYHLVEAVMVKYFKISIFKGFGKFQSDKMSLYEQSMLELGEMYGANQDQNCSPWWVIAKTAGIQTIIFLVAGFIAKKAGCGKSSIIDTISSLYPSGSSFDDHGNEKPPCTDKEVLAADKIVNLCGGVGSLFGSVSQSKPKAENTFPKGDHPLQKATSVPVPQQDKPKPSMYRKPKLDDDSSASTVSSSVYRRRR